MQHGSQNAVRKGTSGVRALSLLLVLSFIMPSLVTAEDDVFTTYSNDRPMRPLNIHWAAVDGVVTEGVGSGDFDSIEIFVKSPPKGFTFNGEFTRLYEADHIMIADFSGNYQITGGHIKFSGTASAWAYCNSDGDNDRLMDCHEMLVYGTDPSLFDTDGDGLGDGDEVLDLGTDPLNADTDGDGVGDGTEVTDGTDPLNIDTDGDGLDDGAEKSGSQNPYGEPTDGANSDSDGDGLGDGDEALVIGTDPNNADTDGDGLADSEEFGTHGTDTLDADSDDDGLSDGQEVHSSLTDPNNADSDDDGLTDGEEYNSIGTNPNNADTDGDGLSDGVEVQTTNTDPLSGDSDGDQVGDGDEVGFGTDPNDADSDDDGLSDGQEIYTHGTDPLDADSDNDGLSDGSEVNSDFTDPLDADTDDDGLGDGQEVGSTYTDPNDSDSDDDGLGDGQEVHTTNTDPNNADSDADGLTDGSEVNTHSTDPNNADSDADGLSDGAEINSHSTDPNNADSDGEGVDDGTEVLDDNTNPNAADTDSDGLDDLQEKTGSANSYGGATDPNNADSDGDGLSDGEEALNLGTDPNDADTDDGGASDGVEASRGTDPFDASDDAFYTVCSLGEDNAAFCGTAMDIETVGQTPADTFADGTYTDYRGNLTVVVDGNQWIRVNGGDTVVQQDFQVTFVGYRGDFTKATVDRGNGIMQDIILFDGIAEEVLRTEDDEEVARQKYAVESDEDRGKLRVAYYGIIADSPIYEGEVIEVDYPFDIPIYYEFDFWKHEDDVTETGQFHIKFENGTYEGNEGMWIIMYNEDPYVSRTFIPGAVPLVGGTGLCLALC